MLAYFGNNLDNAVSSGTAYPLVAGVPADGCSPLSYPYKLPGKVVLLARGNCTFQTKVGIITELDNVPPQEFGFSSVLLLVPAESIVSAF